MRTFDYTALEKRQWDSETLGLIAQIHEYKGRQDLYLKRKPETLDRLVTMAKIQSTESSNKIEGIVTTVARMKLLCLEKTTPRTRDEKEILGYRDVLNTIHENFEYIPIRASYILQLHRDLYRYSEKSIGGRFKNTQNYISEQREDGTSFVRFTPLAPFETPNAIDAICENYNRAIDACVVDPLLLIPTFITDFLCIHPFGDGNGRMSRLLTMLLLYRSGYAVGKYISIEKKIEANKSLYYDALERSSMGWHEGDNDATPFIKYILGIILAAYREFEQRVDIVGEKQNSMKIVQKAIAERFGRFTKSDIMESCPSIGKASIEIALKKLTEGGEIERRGNGKNTFYVKKS
ncbi:MAG: Fic family protein [Roseburia sp.]|nr:Fic family protein [Roseburia sp.]